MVDNQTSTEVEDLALPPQGTLSTSLSGSLEGNELWATLRGENIVLQGMASYGEGGVNKLGAIPLNTLEFKEGMLGVVPSDELAEFWLFNPNSGPATVIFTAYGPDGAELEATEEMTIAANQSLLGGVDGLFDNITLTADDYVRVESDVNIYGFERVTVDGRIEMLPVLK